MGIKTFWDKLTSPEHKRVDDPVQNIGCDAFEVNNWSLSDFVLRVLVPAVGTVPFPLNEQMLMAAAVCRLRPTHIFEWGTHVGKSARLFYETCRAFDIPAEIHSIDLPEDVEHVEHPGEKRGALVRGLDNVHLHTGDGLDTALDIVAAATHVARPLFLVDGDHAYESVARELDGIASHLPQASILAHDTFFQSEASGYNVGPHKAVEEFLEKHPGRYSVLRQDLGLPGMTLLWCRDGEGTAP